MILNPPAEAFFMAKKRWKAWWWRRKAERRFARKVAEGRRRVQAEYAKARGS